MNGLELLRSVRRVIILVVGMTIVLLGLVLVFTPGPALIVVPAGLALLATEFAWARRLLQQTKRQIDALRGQGEAPDRRDRFGSFLHRMGRRMPWRRSVSRTGAGSAPPPPGSTPDPH